MAQDKKSERKGQPEPTPEEQELLSGDGHPERSTEGPSEREPNILPLAVPPRDPDPVPFPRRVIARDPRLLADDILPSGVLLEFVPADILNAFINVVEIEAVITERDPEEDDRYLTVSNRFYTHFHEFGTVIHVVASSSDYWWYFCYDIDAADCVIGRTEREEMTLEGLVAWVYERRVSNRYPVLPIDVEGLTGWRSFQ